MTSPAVENIKHQLDMLASSSGAAMSQVAQNIITAVEALDGQFSQTKQEVGTLRAVLAAQTGVRAVDLGTTPVIVSASSFVSTAVPLVASVSGNLNASPTR
jgi:hypothetical protein